MTKSSMLALLLLASAAGASAADENNGASPVPDKKDKVICHTEKVTGSRSKVYRTCMTRAEWDELASKTKKGLDDMARQAGGGANSSFDPSKAPGVGGN